MLQGKPVKFRQWQCVDRASGEGAVVESDIGQRSLDEFARQQNDQCGFFYQLCLLKSIRRSLPISATRTLLTAFVFSCCDNHNGLLAGVTKHED